MKIIKQELQFEECLKQRLDIVGTEIVVKQINFRESICKPCQELYDNGYIDTTKPMIKIITIKLLVMSYTKMEYLMITIMR